MIDVDWRFIVDVVQELRAPTIERGNNPPLKFKASRAGEVATAFRSNARRTSAPVPTLPRQSVSHL